MNDDPRKWVGRGNENVGSKPFGWANNMERRGIRDHLRKRGRYAPTGYDARGEFLVSRIQLRLRKYQPTFAQRCAAAQAQRDADWIARGRPAAIMLNDDERAYLRELLEGANHPLGQQIAGKLL